ncbi:uncharacterized protein LOC127663049 [Xyrauchen texanus]|uniref:uncharacterized protein LOC127663049 n=1 Tax=Xyrauchen texanus TaxID=154827 RepID=UPI002241BF47|nr:uncharacterized protein LOC127663049 [Xyrauchen texanus]XP_052010411.1 uncharacterized protein LOC127663049 [Xyrauchen texanus]
MGAFGRALLITACLYFCICIGEPDMCPPRECLNCNNTVTCPRCSSNSSNCTSDCKRQVFSVTLNITSPITVREGDDVTMICQHNLTKGIFYSISWFLDKNVETVINNETLKITRILKTVNVTCTVRSVCGNFSSNLNINIPDDSMVIILVCVGAAAGIIIILAIVMKIKLRRGQVQSQERMRQRQQNIENVHGYVNTISGY